MGIKLFLDGVEKECSQEFGSMAELLGVVMEEQLALGRVITEVRKDGRPFSEVYENQASDISLGEVDLLEVETRSASDFAREFAGKAHLFIEQLKEGFSIAADMLDRPSSMEEGYRMLALSFQAMKDLKNHLEIVAGFLPFPDATGRGVVMWSQLEDLAERIISAQEAGNASETSRLIRERMPSILNEWKKMGFNESISYPS